MTGTIRLYDGSHRSLPIISRICNVLPESWRVISATSCATNFDDQQRMKNASANVPLLKQSRNQSEDKP